MRFSFIPDRALPYYWHPFSLRASPFTFFSQNHLEKCWLSERMEVKERVKGSDVMWLFDEVRDWISGVFIERPKHLQRDQIMLAYVTEWLREIVVLSTTWRLRKNLSITYLEWCVNCVSMPKILPKNIQEYSQKLKLMKSDWKSGGSSKS